MTAHPLSILDAMALFGVIVIGGFAVSWLATDVCRVDRGWKGAAAWSRSLVASATVIAKGVDLARHARPAAAPRRAAPVMR